MTATAPLELGQLLHAVTDSSREAAWEELIARHTRLLLAVARSFGGDSDEAMDRYTFILDKLRESEFRRLRAFRSDAGAQFSTWLTVTTRRLCLDHHRARYGRVRDVRTDESTFLRNLRRDLARVEGSDVELENIVDPATTSVANYAVTSERDAMLRDELKKLAPRDRLLLALRFGNDLSASRIAALVGEASQFTVYHRLNAILSGLRAALVSRGIENAEG